MCMDGLAGQPVVAYFKPCIVRAFDQKNRNASDGAAPGREETACHVVLGARSSTRVLAIAARSSDFWPV